MNSKFANHGTAMQRLTGLDALRGVAAIVIVMHHISGLYLGRYFPLAGNLAVDFFFMLSGYVMARTYEPKMGEELSAVGFIWKRVKRLWGTMTVGALLGFAVVIQTNPALALKALPIALLFFPLPRSNDMFPLNSPAWSIFFELFANLLHVLVLRFFSSLGLVLIAILALSMTALLSAEFGHFPAAMEPETWLIGFFRVVAPYCLGIVLYRSLVDRAFLKIPTFALYAALPLIIVLGGNINQILFGAIFVLAICPLVIAFGLSVESRCGDFLGRLSFPLYATHVPVIKGVQALGGGILVAAVAALSIGIAVAAFSNCHGRSFRPRWLSVGSSTGAKGSE